MTTTGGSPARTDDVPHLRLAEDEGAEGDLEVLSWFAEAQRLLAEAEERFAAGAVLPTLSSLTAIPPLHKMLIDRCVDLLNPEEGEDTDDFAPGLYL